MLEEKLSFRDINLRVFQRLPLPHVFFQPRIEPWFQWHAQRGLLPPDLQGLDLPQAFDVLPAGMRYLNYWTGIPNAWVKTLGTLQAGGEMVPDALNLPICSVDGYHCCCPS